MQMREGINKLIIKARSFSDNDLIDSYGKSSDLLEEWFHDIITELRYNKDFMQFVPKFIRLQKYYKEGLLDSGHLQNPLDNSDPDDIKIIKERKILYKKIINDCVNFLEHTIY